ncbi:prevent-host-death protein [Pseudomonas sp. DTU12.3]|uniref:type II toxin-antitoxin system Phd/YefM family antitoxin n=1 Tax=unclassified Pseudomonas TaxID=196821 RepID=UPI001012C87B|nr:type II toxin-antitoxin system Phd/YefM family antitoxin [Pseudomonas sp. DTU12.3]QAX84326.1 prevent-host-death protein [Pseudomonas sp. DTU12.3]
MPITTLSSREFEQDTSGAQVAAHHGPVMITDHGKASHVLLCFEEYQKLISTRANIVNLLQMPKAVER